MHADETLVVKFEEEKNGICLTPCPWGVNCMVNSMTCSLCHYNFGLKEPGVLQCVGHRMKKEEV